MTKRHKPDEIIAKLRAGPMCSRPKASRSLMR